MVNPVNGAGSQQSAIVNPFQQRPDQVRTPDRDEQDNSAKRAGSASNIQTGPSRASGNNVVARAGEQDNKSRSEGSGRGTLVDITV